ncbi:MAG: hypothetical protein ACQETH_08905 [Candidatus Rifleibacteriota bacterium]
MRRIFFILSLVLIVGCNNQNHPPENLEEAKSTTGSLAASAPAKASTVARKEKRENVKISPLEVAQKEYLAAYDDYVRLLKESGPQTLETLQALANYQKKYQLYQMLLKAEDGEPEVSN